MGGEGEGQQRVSAENELPHDEHKRQVAADDAEQHADQAFAIAEGAPVTLWQAALPPVVVIGALAVGLDQHLVGAPPVGDHMPLAHVTPTRITAVQVIVLSAANDASLIGWMARPDQDEDTPGQPVDPVASDQRGQAAKEPDEYAALCHRCLGVSIAHSLVVGR